MRKILIAMVFAACGDDSVADDARVLDARETVAEVDASAPDIEIREVIEVIEVTPETVVEVDAPDEVDEVDGFDVAEEDAAETDASGGCALGPSVRDELYEGLAALRDEALRGGLHELVTDGAQGFSYDAARNLMYGVTGSVDVDASNEVECVYTGVKVMADGTRSPGSGDLEITTEHSWPRSDGAESFPAEGDLHHLYPVLSHANGTRGINEFGDTTCGEDGESACAWSQGGSNLGSATDGRPVVFEVRPERRGDIARAHFYFAVRYELSIAANEEATLRRWHCEDPPTDDERARNDRVAAFQKNRNPFIDQPQLVESIDSF